MTTVIKVDHVSIRYLIGDFKSIGLKEYILRRLTGNYRVNSFWADRDITFSLEKGEMLGIIGANGAGKSTLLKALSGIMVPTCGTIEIHGNIAALLELASGFDSELTVRENVFLRGALLGYTEKFMIEKYDEIIAFAELGDFQDYMFSQLSSGMKSRLAFSIACLVDPDIIILDEVLSVGDGAFRNKSGARMKEILSNGVTGILVSHSIEQIKEVCNKVLWLDHGKQIAFGNTVEICEAYEKYYSESRPDRKTITDKNSNANVLTSMKNGLAKKNHSVRTGIKVAAIAAFMGLFVVVSNYYNLASERKFTLQASAVSENNADNAIVFDKNQNAQMYENPDIIYLNDPLNGYQYWMTATSYSNQNNEIMRLMIFASNDLKNWNSIAIRFPNEGSMLPEYMETSLVYNDVLKRLECWTHVDNEQTGIATICRCYSTDGIRWSDWDNVFSLADDKGNFRGLSIIFEEGTYKMWSINDDQALSYEESTDGRNWFNSRSIQCSFPDRSYRIMHLNVIHTMQGYEMVCAIGRREISQNSDRRFLCYSWSKDNITYDEFRVLLAASERPDSFDENGIGDSSLAFLNGQYTLFYTGIGGSSKTGIGEISGSSIFKLNAYDKYTSEYEGMTN